MGWPVKEFPGIWCGSHTPAFLSRENYEPSLSQQVNPSPNEKPGICNTLERCQKGHIRKEANVWIRMQTIAFIIGIILLFMALFKCLKVLANNKS